MNDDDIIIIGKLRRPGKPGASVTFDPGYGIRIEGEAVPPDADQAARWVRKEGWLRVPNRLKTLLSKGEHPEIEHFVDAARRRGSLRII